MKIKIRWLISCLIFLLISCVHKKQEHTTWIPSEKDSLQEHNILAVADKAIINSISLIHSGDIITRTGNDFTSQSLRSLNRRDKTYSHIGIASIENDSVFIYHALGGEWNPDEKIRRDFFSVFADPVNNNGIGIFRLDVSEDQQREIAALASTFYKAGVTFDMNFDLLTDDKMYCAEFVMKTIERSIPQRLAIPLSHINNFKFVGVDDIFLVPGTRCMQKIKFRNG